MPDVIQVQRPGEGEPTSPHWPDVPYGGKPPRRQTDGGRIVLPWQALGLALLGAAALVAFGWWRYDTYCQGYQNPCWWHGPLLTSAGVLSAAGLLVAAVYGFAGERRARVAAAEAEALQLTVRPDAFGEPVPLWALHRPDTLEWLSTRYRERLAMEVAIAPYKIYSGVDTLNEGAKTEVKTNLGEPPALPAPAEAPSELASERDWLGWVDRTPHLIIAGRTDAGKTTHATAILAERAAQGEQIAVFDPHHQPGKWLGLPVTGAGRDFEGILAGLMDVVREMDDRFKAFAQGTPTEAFERLTVLVDEVPAIYDMCVKLTGSRRSVVDDRWPQFARRLGSEARKVRISVVLLTQSHLVQDIGVNVAMRENFTRIALGDKARDLLDEESVKEQRMALLALLRDRPFPAAMEYRNRYYVLENSGVPALAARSVGALAVPWLPAAAAAVAPPQPTRQELQERAVRAAIARGWTRDQARSAGLRFDNNLWTRLGGV